MGAPCGGAQHAAARAVLPDTGINAKGEVLVVLSQRDPELIGELTDVAVWHLWPAGAAPDAEPDPRVRLVRDDGRVLLDTLGSRYDQPTNTFSRPTWAVLQTFKSADRRNALFQGFQDQTLWVELWQRDAVQPGTRVRLRTESANVTPKATCL